MENEYSWFYNGATILSVGLLSISVFIGIYLFYVFKREEKWYLYYLKFIFLIEFITISMGFLGEENILIYPIYVVGEFIILTMMFSAVLVLPRKFYGVFALIVGFLCLEMFWLWTSGGNLTSGNGKAISHLTVVCLGGYALIRALRTIENEEKNRFLIVYGCLVLYYSVSIILFLLLGQLPTMTERDAYILWGMNNVFSSVLYGASLYTFLKLRKSM